MKELKCTNRTPHSFNRIKELPSHIGELGKLRDLRISHNLLEEVPVELFDRLGRGALEKIDLSHNPFDNVSVFEAKVTPPHATVGGMFHTRAISTVSSHSKTKSTQLEAQLEAASQAPGPTAYRFLRAQQWGPGTLIELAARAALGNQRTREIALKRARMAAIHAQNDALEKRRAFLPSDDLSIAVIFDALATSHSAIGDSQTAAEFRSKAHEIMKKAVKGIEKEEALMADEDIQKKSNSGEGGGCDDLSPVTGSVGSGKGESVIMEETDTVSACSADDGNVQIEDPEPSQVTDRSPSALNRTTPLDRWLFKSNKNSGAVTAAVIGGTSTAVSSSSTILGVAHDDRAGRHPPDSGWSNVKRRRIGTLTEQAAAKTAAVFDKSALKMANATLKTSMLRLASELLASSELKVAHGRLQEAAARQNEAVAIRKDYLLEDDLRVAAALESVGLTAQALGQDQSATDFHREALTIRRRTLPEEHPL